MQYLALNLWPELLLCITACILMLLGAAGGTAARKLAPLLAIVALGIVFFGQWFSFGDVTNEASLTNAFDGRPLAQFTRLLAAGSGILFVLLAWPGKNKPGGLAVGGETGEYYALMLLSLAGLMLAAGSNSLIMLFLGIELASIPTYIMVSISRPLPIAQEAGVKYFFLGALSAALMLLGFSYLYGATGTIYLDGQGVGGSGILDHFSRLAPADFSSLHLLALVLLLSAFAFKMAAFPLHVYAADVYQGAATPMTALLSVVPKASGLVALLKILLAVGGTRFLLPHSMALLLVVIATLTMTVGNILALLQNNVKRTFAYSSVAHSGYMLAGVAAMVLISDPRLKQAALAATLFYIASYALMNTGVFAVLQQLPARRRFGDESTQEQLENRGAASAETFDDVAGHGKSHPILGLLMSICCLSLVGIPFTGGFLGKVLIVKPLLTSGSHALLWLAVAMMLNAAISAAYYLRLPGAMFFRPFGGEGEEVRRSPLISMPATLAALLCVAGTLALGLIFPVTEKLSSKSLQAARSSIAIIEEPPTVPVTPPSTPRPRRTPTTRPPANQ